MTDEKKFVPYSGFLFLLLTFVSFFGGLALIIGLHQVWAAALVFIGGFMMGGFIIVNPNEANVLVLFGDYRGTIKQNGFFWVNPFYSKNKISLRARNLDSKPIKVNDKLGNPIMLGTVLVWQVEDTFKASFDVDDFQNFVEIQSEAALRKLGGIYPYDNFEDDGNDEEITLRSGGEEVNHALEEEMRERLSFAGINVIEARINYLAYAQEIASAMLQRQQAAAIIAARHKIVEGAVGMVEMALEQLSEKDIMELDNDKRAAMVSNLMVVLCSDKATSPVINTGSLYQ